LQKWIAAIQMEVAQENDLKPGDPKLVDCVSKEIAVVLSELSEMAYGFAFANVLDAYWRGMKTGDDGLKRSALRWLRGEYATKTEAKKELPVDCIIDDQSWYDFIKLFGMFAHRAGYKGLLVFVDEGVNLYKITNKQSRDANYEKVLTIFNDTMQGKARYIGVFLSGTPQFVYDERRGLFSYQALRSRLGDNRFEGRGFVDFTSPVIKLNQLTHEEIYLLLERLCNVHGEHFEYEPSLGQKELTTFMESVFSRLGAETMVTPREVTRDFLGLLNILYQNPDAKFEILVSEHKVNTKVEEVVEIDEEDDIFAEFDI